MLANTSPHPIHLDRALRLFLIGDALVLAAGMVGQVIVPWWIAADGGIHDLASYLISAAIVASVGIPVMSMLADRYDKRFFILAGLGANLLGSALLAIFAATKLYDIRIIMLLGSISMLGTSMVSPITNVIAAEFLPSPSLLAYQRQRLFQALGTLGGPVLGSASLAYGGIAFGLWTQALLLVAGLLLMRSLPKIPSTSVSPTKQAWMHEFTIGVRIKWRIALERNWTIISFFVGILLIPASGMLLPLKVHEMGLPGKWLGISEAAAALGMLSGITVGTRLSESSLIDRYWVRAVAHGLLGPALILVGFSSTPSVLVGATFLVGLMNSLVIMMGYSRRILAAPLKFRSRMAGVTLMQIRFAAIIGPVVAGAALFHWSIPSTYFLFGTGVSLCSICYLFTPDFRLFMQIAEDEVEEWYGRKYPDAFLDSPKAIRH